MGGTVLSPLQKYIIFGANAHKICKSRYKSFSVLSKLLDFLIFLKIFCREDCRWRVPATA